MVKSITEIVTTMMRMEQSRRNGGIDEIRFSKAIMRIGNLHTEIRSRTDFKLMRIALKRWMLDLLTDLEEITRRHERRIYLESKRTILKQQVEKERFWTQKTIDWGISSSSQSHS